MEFVKRLTAPSTTDEHWIHTSKGGLNECILIGVKSCLPNCVGYSWGRAYEVMGSRPTLSKNNAGGWYDYNDGYERGQEPRFGAIAVWKKTGTTNNWGHVANVEEIDEDGTITTSNSAYGGTRFYTKVIKKPYKMSGYDFLGFIYLPVEFTNSETEKEETETTNLPKLSIDEVAKEVINGKWGNGTERKEKLTNAGYNYSEVQARVNEMLGYTSKNESTSTTPNTDHYVGETVHFDYLYTDSYASKKLKSLVHSGKITKIYKGRKAPYLVGNGTGFLSDDLIL